MAKSKKSDERARLLLELFNHPRRSSLGDGRISNAKNLKALEFIGTGKIKRLLSDLDRQPVRRRQPVSTAG